MLHSLLRLFGLDSDGRPEDPAADPESAVRVAAAALLLESARADGRVHPGERETIERGLAARFGLDAARLSDLLARAEEARRQAVDLHGFTSVLVRRFDGTERLALAEQIWRVVFADGELTDGESILARRLGNLLELRPEEIAVAIHRARGSSKR